MKNVLVLIHDDVGQEARLEAALAVVQAVGGRLLCLDLTELHDLPGDGPGADGGIGVLAFERERELANKALIEKRLAREGVTREWIDAIGYLESSLRQAAVLCDLVVVNSRFAEAAGFKPGKATAALVVKSGKPVLAVPGICKGLNVTGSALIAWNGSAESSTALAAMVPLLRLARSVTILEVAEVRGRSPVAEVRSYLARQGVGARILRMPEPGKPASIVILKKVKSGKFDYLVMGAFGRPRLVEAVFGGVTRTMLAESPIPLFLAH